MLVEREFTEVSLELVIALVEKDSLVPGPTIPVLVRDRGVLAEANIIKNPSKRRCNEEKYLGCQGRRVHR